MRYWIIAIVLVLVIVVGAFTFINRKPASQGQEVNVDAPSEAHQFSSSPP